MNKITAEQRLVFIRQDVARILEQLPEVLLETPIEGFENLGVVLNNIAIASDETDVEPLHWLITWFEVFIYDDEEGTHTLASFDTEKQAKDFIYDYSMRYPEAELFCDEWKSNADGSGVEKLYPFN
jgi:hypothetical protein